MNIKDFVTYEVGGCVRDSIMGLKPNDIDILVTNKTEEEMVACGFIRVGKSSTAPVFIHPEDPAHSEYAIPRTETSTGPGHSDFEYDTEGVTVEADLRRRDFTMNSMAKRGDVIIDPHGGQRDIKSKIIKHTDSRTFIEDPLRVLRAARFSARLGFRIHSTTLSLCRRVGLNVKRLSKERIFGELKKGMAQCRKPSEYFYRLYETGALYYLIPTLQMMMSTPQPKEHHKEGNVWEHTMMALDYAKSLGMDSSSMFAVLFHDIGKVLTDHEKLPSHNGHDGEEAVLLMGRIAKELGMNTKTKGLCKATISNHMKFHRVDEMRAGSIVKILKSLKAGKTSRWLDAFINVGICDCRGRLPSSEPPVARWKKLGERFKEFKADIPDGIARVNIPGVVLHQQISWIKPAMNKK